MRDTILFAAEQLMKIEVGEVTETGYGEKPPARFVQRNGHREHDWLTRAETVEKRIP